MLEVADNKTFTTWKTLISIAEDEKYGIDNDIKMDVLQGCIQRAVAARKWYWRIFQQGLYNPFTGKLQKLHGYEASVGLLTGEGDDLRCISADTPVQALLEAYIEALKYYGD